MTNTATLAFALIAQPLPHDSLYIIRNAFVYTF